MSPDGEASADQTLSSVPSRYIHSDIFARLVQADDDLIGLVAYGLYQQRKRQWIDQHQIDRKRTPSEQEVKDYCYAYQNSVLDDLRHQAESILFSMTESLSEDKIVAMQ